MEEKIPQLKLISKYDFEKVKGKYDFFSGANKSELENLINGANPSDVLALSVIPGSGLKIIDVKILNEDSEDVFIKLLKEGATSPDNLKR